MTEKVWTTQDGREIPISQLEDSHLLSILKMIKSQAEDSAYCQAIADSVQQHLLNCEKELDQFPSSNFLDEDERINHLVVQDAVALLKQRLAYLAETNPNPSGINFLYPDLYQEAINRGLK